MILLQTQNTVLYEALLKHKDSQRSEPLDITFVDFDGVTFHLYTPDDHDFTQLRLSLRWSCFDRLVEYGARDILEREYGEWIQSEAESGWDVSFQISTTQLDESIAKRFSLVKRYLMSAPFERAFSMYLQRASGKEILYVPYREEEAIYFRPQMDRITVIFSTTFKDETDRIFGRVFLQEFVDARRQPSIQNAPQVLYNSKEPPLEIRHIPGLKYSESVGYVTFVLFPRHFESVELREKVIDQLQMFRNYLHYHIKCSKAYMHSRMRTRVSEFLKVLNRAKPERQTTEKKTISGRTFIRQ